MILQLQGCGKVGRCRNFLWVCSRLRRVQTLFLCLPLFILLLLYRQPSVSLSIGIDFLYH